MKKLDIKNILFDFGGTLDTNGIHWSEMYWDAYEASTFSIDKKEYEKAYVAANKKMADGQIQKDYDFKKTIETQISFQLAELMNKGYLAENKKSQHLQEILDHAYIRVQQNISKSAVLLKTLKDKNIRLGLVSNFHGNMPKVLEVFGIAQFFDVVIDSTLLGISKPDPDIFRAAIKAMNIKAEETAVVGDSYTRDIEAAREAGCKTIWIKGRTWSAYTGNETADFITDDIHKIINTL